jgi:hypothetical protein
MIIINRGPNHALIVREFLGEKWQKNKQLRVFYYNFLHNLQFNTMLFSCAAKHGIYIMYMRVFKNESNCDRNHICRYVYLDYYYTQCISLSLLAFGSVAFIHAAP